MPAMTSGTSAARAISIATWGALSGCMRPKKTSGASGPGSAKGQPAGSMPWWIVAA